MSRKLVLADDSITIQKVVELILSEEDFEVKTFSNGDDAWEAINQDKPDIVLADVEMPGVNGYQLCERIKKDEKFKNIPVLLLAGAFEPIDENLAKQVKADDYIVKPFETRELLNKINTMLAKEKEIVEIEEEDEEIVSVEQIKEGEEVEEPVEVADILEDLWISEDTSEPSEEKKTDLQEHISFEERKDEEVKMEPLDIPLVEEKVEEERKEEIKKEISEDKAGVSITTEEEKKTEEEKEEEKIEIKSTKEEFSITKLPSEEEIKEVMVDTIKKKTDEVFSSLNLNADKINETIFTIVESKIEESLKKVNFELMIKEKTEESLSSFSVDKVNNTVSTIIEDKIKEILKNVDFELMIKEKIDETFLSISKDKIIDIVSTVVEETLKNVDIGLMVAEVLDTHIRKYLENIFVEKVPMLVEETVRKSVEEMSSNVAKEIEKIVGDTVPDLAVMFDEANTKIEEVIWETIPELAENIITKEIEKIKSSF